MVRPAQRPAGHRESAKRRPNHTSRDPTPSHLRPVLQAAARFATAIEARSTVPMLNSGLTMPQLRAVKTIQNRGRANGRELAALLKLSPSAIVAISDHLEGMDLVRRTPDTEDRRITWFVLTERGGDLLRRTSPDLTAATAVLKTRVARLSACERDGFVTIATAFADAFGSLVGEGTPSAGMRTSRALKTTSVNRSRATESDHPIGGSHGARR